MRTLVAILAVAGLAVAVPMPSREKRQIGCASAFQNVPNLCLNNPTGQVFFSHPTDPTKFVQCDINSRMYIIQCPANEVFVISTNGCQLPNTQPVTPQPVTNAPTTPRPVTVRPVVVTPQVPINTNNNNPCTPQHVAQGQLYFAYPGDSSKFYECDLQGNPSILSCPNLLVWDQTILSCVYPFNARAPGQPKPTPHLPAGNANNPCTSQAVSAGRLFFPDPDPTKYIQCDLWGDAFVNTCPSKLVWNAYLETCYSPFLQAAGSGRK